MLNFSSSSYFFPKTEAEHARADVAKCCLL